MDPGHISKLERSLRPPPEIVPTVQRIGAALGFMPDSAEFRELVETAYRERFPRKQQGGISAILTVIPATAAVPRGRGLGGLSPQSEIPTDPAKPLIDVSGDEATIPTNDLMARLAPKWREAAPVPPIDSTLLSDRLFHMLQSALTGYGYRVTEFSREEDIFAFVFSQPNKAKFRLEARLSRVSSPDETPPKS